MRTISSILMLALTSMPLAAEEASCTFQTECLEGETCNETSFSMTYLVTSCPRDPGPRGIVAQTDFGDLSGQEVSLSCQTLANASEASTYVLSGDGAAYLLSRFHEQAWLSVRMDGPFTINYLGTCEDLK